MADADHRRLSPNAAAILVLVVLGAALLLWQRPWQSLDDSAPEIPDNSSAVLTQQFRSLSAAQSEAAFVAAAGDTRTARKLAGQAWSAREALDAQDVELRYVSGGEVADRPDGSSEATVEVSWRSGESGLGEATSRRSAVAFRMVPQDDGTLAIGGVRPVDGALPLWLAGDITIQRRPGTVVIRVDGGDPALPVESMASQARDAVADAISGTRGAVTIVSPRTQDQMARVVGQDVSAIAQIAAVTTRLDGRSGETTGNVIVLNPAVFDTMDRRAAQVVISHEATHLLTGAVGTSAETWVVEGFADFVALRDDTAPLSISAGQILAAVKAGSLPTALPAASDFNSTGRGLGSVYESAWLIFRLLAETNSDQDIVEFHQSVLDGEPLDDALDTSFGTTVKQLTADWRRYLTKSASTVS